MEVAFKHKKNKSIKQRVEIYNPNSFGGNYDYAHELLRAYSQIENCECKLVLPKNSSTSNLPHRILLLLPDKLSIEVRIIKKLYFLFRTLVNPILFWFHLLFQKKSYVIFNDFDQTSSFFWTPLFMLLKKKHTFSVFLHDPDRDKYFTNKRLSILTMNQVMRIMDFAMYHEFLPEKEYYNPKKTMFFSVPHGIYYPSSQSDPVLEQKLSALKKNHKLVGIIGNIRFEKNYHAAIAALQYTKNTHLVIAGKPSSSNVDINELKTLATSLGVDEKITWLIKYLNDDELTTLIKHLHVILLNYSSSFTSQSGILNLIAPYAPEIIVAKTNSGLYKTCSEYKLGIHIEADNPAALKNTLVAFENGKLQQTSKEGWKKYKTYASWTNNVKITLNKFVDR